MNTSGLTSEAVRGALYDLDRMGIASNDTALTAYVHAGVRNSSRGDFLNASDLEEAFINLLRETAPDMQVGRLSASTSAPRDPASKETTTTSTRFQSGFAEL